MLFRSKPKNGGYLRVMSGDLLHIEPDSLNLSRLQLTMPGLKPAAIGPIAHRSIPMADDDDVIDDFSIDAYEDPIAQRALACVAVGRAAMEAKEDDGVRDILLTMMRKLTASIKTPPAGSLTSVPGGKS